MKSLFIVILILLIMGPIISQSQTFRLKLTKLTCKCTDKTFCNFEICRIKALSRNLQYIQVHIKFLQLPITQIETRFRFMKRANGYKPFLYDFTLKCDFIKHLNPVTSIVWSWFTERTNLNHSCPLVEDFIIPRIENIYLQQKLKALPVPDGDYGLFAFMTVDNKIVIAIEFYGVVS